jgi:hypothetical protein
MESFIGLIENTWYIWWILAVVAVLRWFHGVSDDFQEEAAGESRKTGADATALGQHGPAHSPFQVVQRGSSRASLSS